jgi:hypothetical protein
MKISYEDIAHILADRHTDVMSREDLEQVYYDYMFNYFRNEATDEELIEQSRTFNVIDADETLELSPP